MTIKNVTINGKDYPAIVSNRVLIALEESETNMTAVIEDISKGSMKRFFWLLALMLDAGYRWAKIEDPDTAVAPPSIEDIWDSTGINEFSDMSGQLLECITASMSRTVEVENKKSKNARASLPVG